VHVRCAYQLIQEKIPNLFFCKLQRARESVRENPKSKNQTPAGCCRAVNREGHHRQTPRPVRLTPDVAAALSPSPHSVTRLTKPDAPHPFRFRLSLRSQIWYFFFSFLFLLFCSYLLLSLLVALLVFIYLVTYFVSCLEFRH
jgi:hypothetical protein